VQLCIVHLVRASLKYVSWKQREAVAAELRAIYTAATAEQAEAELDVFAAKWDQTHPTISQIWRRNWAYVTPLFAFPAEIRKVIYTTNAVESLNMTLRKVIKMRASFPNEEAALKLLYMALEKGIEQVELCAGLEGGLEPLSDLMAGAHCGLGTDLNRLYWTL
jgi:putative transposase